MNFDDPNALVLTLGYPFRIVLGDATDILRSVPSDYIDSIVCDPPAGIAFMGREWDQDHGGREGWVKAFSAIFSECLRVLKPGGHALVWAIPRTSHWTGCALEDAGFVLRDCVTHLYGTGFPKSLNVSKAIDKMAGAERKDLGLKPLAVGRTSNKTGGKFGSKDERDDDRESKDRITALATPEAEQWDGWGTALKPAAEFWWLVRKPLGEKTVAKNVLKHGTGALNIDGCRIDASGPPPSVPQPSFNSETGTVYGMKTGEGRVGEMSQSNQGRWPANLVLSHHPDCKLVGTKEVKTSMGTHGGGNNPEQWRMKPTGEQCGYGDENGMETVEDWECVEGCPIRELEEQSGSSRFFYQAKAATKEKFAFCRTCDKVIPYKERKQHKQEGHDLVFHPTQKGIEIMRYLCRLITPPGGIILDPFTGTGSTGVAALQEDFRFMGIERDDDYSSIALHRLKLAAAGRREQ